MTPRKLEEPPDKTEKPLRYLLDISSLFYCVIFSLPWHSPKYVSEICVSSLCLQCISSCPSTKSEKQLSVHLCSLFCKVIKNRSLKLNCLDSNPRSTTYSVIMLWLWLLLSMTVSSWVKWKDSSFYVQSSCSCFNELKNGKHASLCHNTWFSINISSCRVFGLNC